MEATGQRVWSETPVKAQPCSRAMTMAPSGPPAPLKRKREAGAEAAFGHATAGQRREAGLQGVVDADAGPGRGGPLEQVLGDEPALVVGQGPTLEARGAEEGHLARVEGRVLAQDLAQRAQHAVASVPGDRGRERQELCRERPSGPLLRGWIVAFDRLRGAAYS